MNREWVTLAFGILLVTVVAVVSVWQNYPGRERDTAAAPPAVADTPAAPVPEAPEEKPPTPERAQEPGAPQPQPQTPAPGATIAPGPATAPTQAAARLDASVPVVHKHRFGDCEGTLRAAGGTLGYTTAHNEDGFRVAFAEIEAFDFDAAKNNLRVRRRGGRTWNFTTDGERAAALAAFHREASRGLR